jgi:DNA polymerase-3 subunit delta
MYMTEILYTKFDEHLETVTTEPRAGVLPPVYLIFGDDVICKDIWNRLLNVLMPPAMRLTSHEEMDGVPENLPRALLSMNTYGFVPGRKIVSLLNSTFFLSKENDREILQKIRDNVVQENHAIAASLLARLIALHEWTIEEIASDSSRLTAIMDPDDTSSGWLDGLIRTCLENSPPDNSAGIDIVKPLQEAIRKGFPEDHHLIITAGSVDRRKSIYRIILEKGLVVDCTIPSETNTRAGRQAMESILDERIQSVLSPSGHRLKPAARNALLNKTGYDLRTVLSEVEKLVQYVGNRTIITEEDVQRALQSSRKDPIYEFTNALTDKHWGKSMQLLDGLLTHEFAPPQILAAIGNQIRKLLVARDFCESSYGKRWHDACAYQEFQSHVLPDIEAYDAVLSQNLQEWKKQLKPGTSAANRKVPPSSSEKPEASDLMIRKKSTSPYPTYLLLKKAGGFPRKRLVEIFRSLAEADRKIKTSAQNPRTVLERIVLEICRPHSEASLP